MSEFMPNRDQKTDKETRDISTAELFDFLTKLAELLSSPQTGNQPMAAALKDLAAAVRRNDPRAIEPRTKQGYRSQRLNSDELSNLRQLGMKEVEKFINDPTKTKNQLLDLAAARFSIPTSQLQRQKLEEVRAGLMSALLHESSIEILSSEAGKEGANRTS